MFEKSDIYVIEKYVCPHFKDLCEFKFFHVVALIPMLDDSSQYENNCYPSLVDLPTELILHIIRILPKSPYHKCLSVCQRLNEIENGYVTERSAMCICRLQKHSPNLSS